ncbi:MAG: zinc-binding dehydrogenase [Mycobacterium sp.]|nr:zinc-binding dehydrogenase [Mycobacterium sp.]
MVGLGGLGHVAVKLTRAMGADVTVLSRSLKKRDDGLRLGADHYYSTSDPETFKQLNNTFDLVVNTVNAFIDVDAYLSLVAPNGSMVNVGIPPEPFPVNVWSLLHGRRSFSGSFLRGIRETQEMLDFCAVHQLGACIEVIAAEQINEAFERIQASDVRYRFVIDVSTMMGPSATARVAPRGR